MQATELVVDDTGAEKRPSKPEIRKVKRISSRRILLPVVILSLSLVTIQSVRIFTPLMRLTREISSLQDLVAQGGRTPTANPSINDVESMLAPVAQDARELREAVGPWVYLLPLLAWVPRYGGDLQYAPALLELGEQTAVSAQKTLNIASALSTAIDAGQSNGMPIGVNLLQAVESQSIALQETRQSLVRLAGLRKQIDPTRLSRQPGEALHRFDEWFPQWQSTIAILASAPSLLGADRTRTWLLIAQNNDELRATGGFLTGVAELHLQGGEITIGEFQDSYSVDNLSRVHPVPPGPLQRYMYAGLWVFRDANWSPDWPTAARQMEEIYRIDREVTPDGVIAVNLNALPQLVEALGPLTLEPGGDKVSAANVGSRIRANWGSPLAPDQSGDRWSHRKDYLGLLFQALVRRLMAGDFDRYKLGRTLMDAARSKDLLFYMNDGDLTFGGALYGGPDDALMIVDSNVGFNKVDGSIERRMLYSVRIDDTGAWRATATITYTNLSPDVGTFCVHQPLDVKAYSELQQGCYWNYVRVFAPQGSELIRASGVADIESVAESNRTVFGGYLLVPRGERASVRFEYRLPPTLGESNHYTLHLEKQPGALPYPASIQISVPGAKIIGTSASLTSIQYDQVEFSWPLEHDEQISIAFERDNGIFRAVLVFAVLLAGGVGGAAIVRARRKPAKPKHQDKSNLTGVDGIANG